MPVGGLTDGGWGVDRWRLEGEYSILFCLCDGGIFSPRDGRPCFVESADVLTLAWWCPATSCAMCLCCRDITPAFQ